MSKKTDSMIKKIMENVSRINDEQILASILVYTSLAAKNPTETKAKAAALTTPKPKTPMKAPTQIATESHILEYEFGNKKMIAFQSNGKPSDEVLAVCKGAHMRFYSHVPSNPFGNTSPFWAGKATEELKAALMGAA